ncbi:MAG TPA: alpha-glucan family phosphorylase [Vicinamibacteria bacterium]|nr:alpha-glucan family phosphorylase [Vicinamibacteria bacterium]
MPDVTIAYFSMEIGLTEEMPTYSGGLGVLAGDTLRAAADWGLPLAAVTLLHRKGYFRQRLDSEGSQTEEPDGWKVEDHLEEMTPRVQVEVEGKPVILRCWRRVLEGVLGASIPVYFLDSDLLENGESQRRLTDHLYGGDKRYRLSQECILGVGGLRMMRALGYDGLETYHMNEGHSSFLTLELMGQVARRAGRTEPSTDDVDRVKNHCVFTTHTPVSAGHDRFPKDAVKQVLSPDLFQILDKLYPGEEINLTDLALMHSRFVNGVARRHGEVTRGMFGGFDVRAITNGIHAATWAAASWQRLFDRNVPGWREDNQSLRYVAYVPLEEIEEAHLEAKRALLDRVRADSGRELDSERFTIGFARRATAYKRAGLLLRDVERLNRVAEREGPLQILYAGKAHAHDDRGKEIIREIFAAREKLSPKIELVYLEDYGVSLAARLTSGVDLWLNTPEAPLEASGTSGMKAAVNGVPSLSILDGWWIEGHIEGVTGWSIGAQPALPSVPDGEKDAENLYRKLESVILPLYYRDRAAYLEVMRHAVALNGSFFNTERMVSEYARQAYRLAGEQ